MAVAVTRRDDGGLQLSYRLRPADLLRLPAPARPGPADGLWRQTCCEVFIATVDGPAYREFNLSPSGQWAVYDFATYRQRNDAWQASAAPSIACRHAGDDLQLDATLPAELLPAGANRLGLSVVAEATDGSLSYWALDHAGERPDFHLAASFTLPLP